MASAAQIDKKIYENMLNYWNCKYTVEYLDCVNHTPIPDTLRKVSFDNALDITALHTLSQDYKFSRTYTRLSEKYYKDRKDKWTTNLSNKQIKSLLKINRFDGFRSLEATTKSLDKEFDDRYSSSEDEETHSTENKNANSIGSNKNGDTTKIELSENYISISKRRSKRLIYKIIPSCKNIKLELEFNSTVINATIEKEKGIIKINALEEGTTSIILKIKGSNITPAQCTVKVVKEDGFNSALRFLTIIGLIICGIIRFKFWNKIKTQKEKKIFYGIAGVLAFVLLCILYELIRKIVFGVIIVLVAIAVIYFIVKHKNNKPNNNVNIIKGGANNTKKIDCKEYEKLKDKYQSLNEEHIRSLEYNKIILQERNELERKCKALEKNQEITGLPHNDEKQPVDPYTKDPVVEVVSQNISHLYADAIINDIFNKVSELPNDDTVYELLRKTSSDRNAKFTIYKGAYRRIIDTPDFIKGCEKQITGKNDLQVDPGETTQDDLGKWKIIKTARIKFI
jgi:hypothetical protein